MSKILLVALILFVETLALYKSFTYYVLTYLISVGLLNVENVYMLNHGRDITM